MRIKARALGLAAEDYFNDKVLEDTELLYSGMEELPGDFWERQDGALTLSDSHTAMPDVSTSPRVRGEVGALLRAE